jgi:parallel beta-helix repeat protein
MTFVKTLAWLTSFLVALLVYAPGAAAADISGTITATLTIMNDSKLVGDVSCTVSGATCIAFGASSVTLDLNGYSVTGLGDPDTGCSGSSTPGETAINVNGLRDVAIRGPGTVQRSRGFGIVLNNSTGSTVSGVTVSTNCMSGIFLAGGGGHVIEGNVAVRNGHLTNPCGGICLTSGASRNRLRANRVSGNGYVAPGNNFGIGLIAAGVNNNVVDDNTVVGNATGIWLVAGTEGNIIRRNLITANPPVQVSVSNPSSASVDIRNQAAAGANAFVGNVCLTSINAPCPSVGPSLTASPNPIPVTGNAFLGTTTLSWNAPDAEVIEIRIGRPDGSLLALTGNRGSVRTGTWVTDGMIFYLQDVTGGRPLTSDYTLAELVVRLEKR